MAYNTPETVADYLARFQMEITHRGKGTFTPDHVKYSLTIASGGKDFFTTFSRKAAWSSAAPFPVTKWVRTATPSQGKQGMLPPPAMD